MVLVTLRALFVLLMAAVGWTFVLDPKQSFGAYTWLTLAFALSLGVVFICIDILSPRRKLVVFSGTFLGLVVGVLAAYALSFVVTLLVDYVISYANSSSATAIEVVSTEQRNQIVKFLNLLLGIVTCYLSVSFILQTKDDFRFVIPYVEFSRQAKGPRPILLDTNILIDGRIGEIAATGFIEQQLLVPQFVVQELRLIADSGDKLRRGRGRRGLDVLARLQEQPGLDLKLYDVNPRDDKSSPGDVDGKILRLAKELGAKLLTNDFNLAKEAHVQHVAVINLNDLATAVRQQALPGERLTVRLIKPGESAQQGVGYLEDGTMVVVEDGRGQLNSDVEFTVTNTRQTAAGKMIFGRIGDGRSAGVRRPRGEPTL